jgi:hypothetical protein
VWESLSQGPEPTERLRELRADGWGPTRPRPTTCGSVFAAEDLGDKALKTCRLTPGLAEHLAHHGTETQRSRALLHARLGRGAPRRP